MISTALFSFYVYVNWLIDRYVFFKLTQTLALCEKCPNTEFSWSVFSHIRTKYGDLRNKSLYSVRIREYTDQKKTPHLDTFRAVWKRDFQLLIWLVFNCQYTKSCLKCIKSGGSKISQDFWIWTNFTKLCTLEITWISLFAKWSARVFFPFNWYFVLGVEPRLYRPA